MQLVDYENYIKIINRESSMFDYNTNNGKKRDFKLRPALEWAKDAISIEPNNPNLSKSIVNFKSNIKRLSSLQELPAVFVSTVIVSQTALANARIELSHYADSLSPAEHRDLLVKLMNNEIDEVNEKLPKTDNDVPTKEYLKLMDNTYYEIQRVGQHFRSAEGALNDIFAAQITGFWTAFEVFTAELWEEAINFHPEELAELRGSSAKKLYC